MDPIRNGDIPASYVSLSEGIYIYNIKCDVFSPFVAHLLKRRDSSFFLLWDGAGGPAGYAAGNGRWAFRWAASAATRAGLGGVYLGPY